MSLGSERPCRQAYSTKRRLYHDDSEGVKWFPRSENQLPMNWIVRRIRERALLHVSLYTKPGCHLCDEAYDLLRRLSTRYTLDIEEIDIRSDPELFRRFDVRIPVIQFDDGSTLEAPIREPDLRKAIYRNGRKH